MTKTFPAVECPLAETDDERRAVAALIYGQGTFDHENRFRIGGSEPVHEVARIHLLTEPLYGTVGGESQIRNVFGHQLEEPAWIYLENTEGKIFGWSECKGAVGFRSVYGVIFEDPEGDVWFWGHAADGRKMHEPWEERHQGFDELFLIEREAAYAVLDQNGALADNLPAEGEFSLSLDPRPVVTAIPWWSGSEGDEPMVQEALTRAAENKAGWARIEMEMAP